MILAHLSDPHLFSALPGLSELTLKRVLSLASWQRARRQLHRSALVEQVVSDIRSERPDFIAVTGDLVNFSLPREFAAAAAWLGELGPPSRVGVVPGNHEALVAGFGTAMRDHWGAYVRGDDASAGFPWLRRRGDLAIIGVSSAVATPPFFAAGCVGEEQCIALGRLLAQTGAERRFRVVLIHHPPTPVTSRRKGLVDHRKVAETIAREGAELVLHGHTHRAELSWIDAAHARVPVVGVPSASMDPHAAAGTKGGADGAAWFRIAIARSGEHWQVRLDERRVTKDGGITDGVRLVFRLPSSALASARSGA